MTVCLPPLQESTANFRAETKATACQGSSHNSQLPMRARAPRKTRGGPLNSRSQGRGVITARPVPATSAERQRQDAATQLERRAYSPGNEGQTPTGRTEGHGDMTARPGPHRSEITE